MKFTEQQYLAYDPYEGERDVNIRARTVKIATVRKEHQCFGFSYPAKPHPINSGEKARVESALVDGEWGRSYTCIPCMDGWLSEILKPVPA